MASKTSSLPPVEHTLRRASGYYSNLRIHPAIQHLHGGQAQHRKSLGTRDPKAAEKAVRRIKVQLEDQLDAQRGQEAHRAAMAQLTDDQRRRYKEAGGLEGLLDAYARTQTARAFMRAGDPAADDDREVEGGNMIQPGLLEPPSKVIGGGEVTDPMQDRIAVSEHEAASRVLSDDARVLGRTLEALGQPQADVPGGAGVNTLSELVPVYVAAKNPAKKTAEVNAYVARRFAELHGDLALSEIKVGHLREYSDKVLGLPLTTRADVRKLPFQKAVAKAKREKLPTLTEQTRRKHINLLKTLMGFARDHGYVAANPWADFKVVTKRAKYSEAKDKRRPYSPSESRAILAHAKTKHIATIDRWAPMLALYQGARSDEIAQLRRCDVQKVGDVWCLVLTDEGEGQHLKNEASFRTIPLHPTVIEAGFLDHVLSLPHSKRVLFQEQERWSQELHDIAPDGDGYFSGRYGKRISRVVHTKLQIPGPIGPLHSFRHTWEDAADAATIPDSHRRDLAGRSKKGDSQAAYGDGPTMAALLDSLSKVDPLGLPERAVKSAE